MEYIYNSPIGNILISADDNYLYGVSFTDSIKNNDLIPNPIIQKTIQQLNEYFLGKRKSFNLPINPVGTDFQKRVWEELIKIPYGETRTYKEIASNIGKSQASRAVGNANNKNPIGIIIPCHRVIGSNNKLTGYAGGLDKKEKLLKLESLI